MLIKFFDSRIFSKFNSKDVFLFGFSQGGLVCYEMIKILDKTLGGVFPIGGFMSGVKKNITRINPSQKNTPIIIGHGDEDENINIQDIITFIEISLDDPTSVPNINEFIPDYQQIKPSEDPIFWTGPILASDRLIIASSNEEALAVSPYNGRILGVVEMPDRVTVAPIIADGSVYFLADDAQLIAYK